MKLREYFTMDYCNRWLALILPNGILRHPSIATKLPTDLYEQKQSMLRYRWTQRLDFYYFMLQNTAAAPRLTITVGVYSTANPSY
jgi:hypothetical protein